jgi:hypothetical protein
MYVVGFAIAAINLPQFRPRELVQLIGICVLLIWLIADSLTLLAAPSGISLHDRMAHTFVTRTTDVHRILKRVAVVLLVVSVVLGSIFKIR